MTRLRAGATGSACGPRGLPLGLYSLINRHLLRAGAVPGAERAAEIANIAPIHDLPALVSQAGGQGLQMMVGLQKLSQARSRWGTEVAEGFMSLFQTKVVLSGIGDARTLESISLALGEYDHRVVSTQVGTSETDKWLDPHGYNESVSSQTQRQRVLSPGEVAKLPPGHALLLRGPGWRLIGLTPWFRCEPWRTLGGNDGTQCSAVL